jgi:very-short-patch-repair endonuclease
LIDAGLPIPTTQIPVHDAWQLVAVLDMGWENLKVAAEYDGDQHRSDRRQYVRDIRRAAKLERMGWMVVRVIAEDRPDDVVGRALKALESRGFRRDRR